MKKKEGMKKITYLLTGILMLAAMICICGKHVEAASVSSLKASVNYKKYDITGDGKKDVILLKTPNGYDTVGEYDEGNYSYLKVYINGKCALTMNDFAYSSMKSKIITLNNGKSYLYIHLSVGDDYGPDYLYSYRRGKLIKQIDLEKDLDRWGYNHSVRKIDASGNTVNVRLGSMSYGLGPIRYEAKYTYKAGKLKLRSNVHKIIGYYSAGRYRVSKLTASKNMQLYKTEKTSKKGGLLKKGTKVRITKCYISRKKASFYVQGKGWIRSPKTTVKPLFEEIMYAG